MFFVYAFKGLDAAIAKKIQKDWIFRLEIAKSKKLLIQINDQPLPPDDKRQQSWVPPGCTKCGVDMVQRSAKSDPNQGKHFWGCSNYPKCKNIVPIEEWG
jgi:hypothetical protein